MKQIYIEDFRVDVSRCEVHRENDIVSLEPKVLQVLLYLVEHQGEVVSRQALLDEVWSGSIVEANALQRCIGQLRKAFNDDAKQQRIIATYPKNGYSLLATGKKQLPEKTKSKLPPILGLLTVLLIGIVIMLSTLSQKQAPTPDNLQSLSQNQTPDFYTLYSPNGRYVLYPKPADAENSENNSLKNLWVLDITENTETRITPEVGYYGAAAWSPDSQQLVFIQADSQSETACSALKQSSLSTEQPQTLINCKKNQLQSPQWLSLNNIALIETNNNAAKIINYDLNTGTKTTISQQLNQNPQYLAYSSKTDMLAITLIDANKQQQLQLLSISSGESIILDLALPASIINEAWYPSWNPQQDGLILNSSAGVFNISLNGSVSQTGILGSQ